MSTWDTAPNPSILLIGPNSAPRLLRLRKIDKKPPIHHEAYPWRYEFDEPDQSYFSGIIFNFSSDFEVSGLTIQLPISTQFKLLSNLSVAATAQKKVLIAFSISMNLSLVIRVSDLFSVKFTINLSVSINPNIQVSVSSIVFGIGSIYSIGLIVIQVPAKLKIAIDSSLVVIPTMIQGVQSIGIDYLTAEAILADSQKSTFGVDALAAEVIYKETSSGQLSFGYLTAEALLIDKLSTI